MKGFKAGDRVYAPFHGYGTVIEVREHHSVYPIVVKWNNSSTGLVEEVSTFTKDGYLSQWAKSSYTRIFIAKIHEEGEIEDNEYHIYSRR